MQARSWRSLVRIDFYEIRWIKVNLFRSSSCSSSRLDNVGVSSIRVSFRRRYLKTASRLVCLAREHQRERLATFVVVAWRQVAPTESTRGKPAPAFAALMQRSRDGRVQARERALSRSFINIEHDHHDVDHDSHHDELYYSARQSWSTPVQSQ